MSVEVKIELGHKAWKNIKPTLEGHTHDWTVFVQGVNDNEIKQIVEKVIFTLPDGYPDPMQIREKPPFALSDSTSRSFSMQIEVFFCAGANLNKVCYIYDLSISDEEVNSSWEERLLFQNPSEDLKEKLLLAGGKVVDAQKSEVNGAFVKCKVEPDEEIEIIQDTDNVEALNSTVQEIDKLHEILKENESLRAANAEVKEKTNLREKVLASYVEKISSCEKSILTTNKGIKQLKKKIETDEKEVSALKLEVEMLQKELSRIENPPTKKPEEKKKGKKRKAKKHLNKSAPVEKKRGDVIQPTKVISSPSFDVSSTSQSSAPPKEFSVPIKKQNFHKSAVAKRSTSIVQNSSPSKTHTVLNDSSDTSSRNRFNSQSNIEIQPANDNSSIQQNICATSTFSFKSTNACDGEKSVDGSSVKVNYSLNTSEIANNDVGKPVEESSIEANAAVIKSELRNSDCEKPSYHRSMEVDSSVYIPEIRNNDVENSTYQSAIEVDSSLHLPEIRNNVVEKPVEGSSIEANTAMIKSELRNSDCEKPTYQRSMEVDSSLHLPEIRNNDVEKPVERNSFAVITSLNNSEIRKSDIEEPVRINDAEKHLKGSSGEDNASLNKPETKNIVGGISVEVTTPLNKFKITNDDAVKSVEGSSSEAHTATNNDAVKSIEGNSSEVHAATNDDTVKSIEGNSSEVHAATNDDAVKSIEESSSEAHTSFSKLCTEPYAKDLVEELVSSPVKKQCVSSIQITAIKPFSSNCKENGQKRNNFGDKRSSSALSYVDLENKQNRKSKKANLQKFRNVFQSENLNISVICRGSPQDMNKTSTPTLMEFMSDHCRELVVELDRIKNSIFCKFRHKTNPLYYKLGNINEKITKKYFMRYIRSLTDFFTNPKTSFDLATIVYLVVNYLSCSGINPTGFPTCIQNQDTYVFLPKSEDCIISALYEVERQSLPHFDGLIRNALNIIHRVIVSKKRMSVNGLASLCRVFMDICRHSNDRWEPLFLCCETLRLGHPSAPYLINSLATVWRVPFYLHNQFSVEERILLGSIIYGMKEKPLLMDNNLWDLTCRLTSVYFPHPIIVDPHEAIKFLTDNIVSRCNEGLFEKIWILTSPLTIFVLNKSWDWKMYFINEYIVPNLLHFSRRLNEQAFDLFCNLYVEICKFCHQSPFEELQQYFTNTALYEGNTFVQECAAVAMLKYIITTDRHVPAALSFWLHRNKNNPKLKVILDLYCKKVMEFQDNLLLWDDIIIL